MIPSFKKLSESFGPLKAKIVRKIMENFHNRGRSGCYKTMEQIDVVLNGHGVEFIDAGKGRKSPAITYVNMGDTYDCTVMWVNGSFRVGCWGDIVEQGNYA